MELPKIVANIFLHFTFQLAYTLKNALGNLQ